MDKTDKQGEQLRADDPSLREQADVTGSRRDFLRKSAVGVGAAVAAGATAQAFSAETTNLGEVKIPSIRLQRFYRFSRAGRRAGQIRGARHEWRAGFR